MKHSRVIPRSHYQCSVNIPPLRLCRDGTFRRVWEREPNPYRAPLVRAEPRSSMLFELCVGFSLCIAIWMLTRLATSAF